MSGATHKPVSDVWIEDFVKRIDRSSAVNVDASGAIDEVRLALNDEESKLDTDMFSRSAQLESKHEENLRLLRYISRIKYQRKPT